MSLKNIYKAQAKRFNLSSDEESDSDDGAESGSMSPSQANGDEPLIPRKRKHKIYHVRGKRKTKSGNFTWIVCFVLTITCIVGIMLVLLSLLTESSNTHQSEDIFNSKNTNESKIKGCTNITSKRVWFKTIPKLMTETAIRLNDVNDDGVQDILVGFLTALDGYFVDGAPKGACDIHFNKTFPCFGGVLALDGITGNELWRHYTMHEVFALNCNVDIDRDGVRDCLIGGRAGVFEALSAKHGEIIWRFRKEDPGYKEIMGIYTAQFVRDLDGDGVPDVLAAHGGDPLSEPGSKERLFGRLFLFSGKTGQVLQWKNVPDEKETYFSPVVYSLSNGTDIVLFGTGGETHPGSLWAIDLIHLYHGLIGKAVQVYSDNYKGVMVPPVLADLNKDGTVDIIMSMFNTTIVAFDGETYEQLWNYEFPNSETYSTPGAGYFNDDDIPDFFVRYNYGQGFPSYYYSLATILDGITGKPIISPIKNSVMVNTSPLSVSMTGPGNDLFVYWMVDCVGHEGQGDWFEFVKGTNVHEQSRADTCKLRYKTKSFSQLSVMNRQMGFPGHTIYNSLNSESHYSDESGNISKANTKKSKRIKRHVGPPDHGGFQRLIQTGCVAPALSGNEKSRHQIDVVMVTYWMYPAKVRVITEKEKECIAHYRNLSQQGKFENKVDVQNNFNLGNYDEGDTATNICLGKNKNENSDTFYISQSNFNYTTLHFGNLTVYRFRLTCHCEDMKPGQTCSEFLPMNKQSWGGYLGTLSNSYFIPR